MFVLANSAEGFISKNVKAIRLRARNKIELVSGVRAFRCFLTA